MESPSRHRRVIELLVIFSVLFGLVYFVAVPFVRSLTILRVGPNETYTTIQSAIDAASEADTIEIAPGTYEETLYLNPATQSHLTITGGNSANTIVTGGVHFSSSYAGLVLRNLALRGDGNQQDGLPQSTIAVDDGNLHDIVDLTIDHCVLDGESADVGGVGGGRKSIQLSRISGTFTITESEIKNYPAELALQIESASGVPASYVLTNNSVHDNGGGVSLNGLADDFVDSVVVTGNTFSQNGSTENYSRSALDISLADVATVNGNTITGTRAGLSGDGIGLSLSRINTGSVGENTISGNAQGVYLMGELEAGFMGTYHFYRNKISENLNYAFKIPDGDIDTVFIQGNWWGLTEIDAILANIVGIGAVDSYYIDSALTIENTTTPSVVYVDPTYSATTSAPHYYGYDAFSSIPAGINAVLTGGAVHLAPGTYNESQILINKPIILAGESASSTIIDGGDASIVGPGLLRIVSEGNVTVSGLTLRNAGKDPIARETRWLPPVRALVYVNSMDPSSVYTITGNILEGSGDPEDASDVGIFVQEGVERLVVTGNTIRDTAGSAIYSDTHTGEIAIGQNTLDVGLQGFGGIYLLSAGGTVTAKQQIIGNTINTRSFSPDLFTDAYEAPAISIVNSYDGDWALFSDVEISGNIVRDVPSYRSGITIANYGNPSRGNIVSASGVVITNNILTASNTPAGTFGIKLIGPVSGATITGNTISGFEKGVVGMDMFGDLALLVPTAIQFTENSLSENTQSVAWDGLPTLTAPLNYWGSTDSSVFALWNTGTVNIESYYLDADRTRRNGAVARARQDEVPVDNAGTAVSTGISSTTAVAGVLPTPTIIPSTTTVALTQPKTVSRKFGLSDFNVLMVYWTGKKGNFADFNVDGRVDISDFNYLMVHWTI